MKGKNITWHKSKISKQAREKSGKNKGAVIWLTGLPSSGKSTIAVELNALLSERGVNSYILDGDNIRHGLNKDLGFSPQDREENIRRISEVAKLFADSGFLVITAFISPYRKDRDRAKNILNKGDFIEVFIKADICVCAERDPKGLYKKAQQGRIKEFTGVSAPYEEPENPELVIDTEKLSKQKSAEYVLRYLLQKEYIKT